MSFVVAGFIGIVTIYSLSKLLNDSGLHETVIALWVCGDHGNIQINLLTLEQSM